MANTEEFDKQLEKDLENYKKKYHLRDCDIAWVLFRYGTQYYFEDIKRRELEESELPPP